MTFPKRYLVRFGPKQTPHVFTDLLVIGVGIAGVRAALAAPRQLRTLLITKDRLQQSNSNFAQGGIAAVRSPEDRFEDHIEDTLTAGAGLCERGVVEMVVREAPRQIDDLIAYGARFDAEAGIEGGHSHHRIVHALGDATGFEVMRALETIAQRYRDAVVEERAVAVERTIAALRLVRREAFKAWERSNENRVRHVEKQVGDKIITATIIEPRLPNNEYLRTILRTYQQEAKLLGLYPSMQKTPTYPKRRRSLIDKLRLEALADHPAVAELNGQATVKADPDAA